MELASPITVYWDLPPAGAADDLVRTVGEQIGACRPLEARITLPEWPIGEEVLSAVEILAAAAISLSLTVPVTAYNAAREKLPATGPKLKELLISCGSSGELAAHGNAIRSEAVRLAGMLLFGISVPVNRANWRDLPECVAFCRASGITRLVLPMQRLYNCEEPFFISMAEQAELGAKLEEAGGIGDIPLTIHDPFLWRAVNAGAPFPQAGCQAANTMIAIAPDGRVFPCPTLPYELGRLGEQTLGGIIASARKKEIRSMIRCTPSGCTGCPELAACRGGCRGRGLALHGSMDGRDDACG